MPDQLLIFLTAMTPIGELRASIPLGLTSSTLPLAAVFALSVAGNLVPVPFILLALRGIGSRAEQMANPLGALLRWRTRQVRSRYGPLVERYGFPAVVLLVAIPLPFTGAWTGSLAVWTLHVPLRRGVAAIALGVVIAGTVVTALTVAGIELFSRLA